MITQGVYASVVIIDFGGLFRWRRGHDVVGGWDVVSRITDDDRG